MRRNVALVYEDDNTIYLYTHRRAEEVNQIIKDALKCGDGWWHDESYVARIIFSEMVRDDFWGKTGDSLAPYETYAEFPTVKVDLHKQTVDGVPFAELVQEIIRLSRYRSMKEISSECGMEQMLAAGGYELLAGGALTFPGVIFLQFTGIRDKDGREIYEGDIVRFKFHAGDFVAPVSFWRYKWMLERGWHSISIDDEISSFLEVIGNRYEHPELLKR